MNTNELLHVIQTLKETGFSHIDLTHEGSHILLSNAASVGQAADPAYYPHPNMPFQGHVPTFPHLHGAHMNTSVLPVSGTVSTPSSVTSGSAVVETSATNSQVASDHGIKAVEENVSRENEQKAATKELSSHIIESPIVGTFYGSANPDSDPFVSVGSTVKKGQVLCIIEAMKLMNEIESDVDGQVVEILVENEQGVEFGQPLFKIV